MTTIDYAAFAAEALQAIADAGVACTVSRVAEGSPPDPGQPWRVGAPDAATHSADTFVFMSEYPPDQVEKAGGSIVKGDRKALIPDIGFAVEQADLVVIDSSGARWSVVGAVAVPPEAQVVIWKMQVRRWPSRTTK